MDTILSKNMYQFKILTATLIKRHLPTINH